MTDNLKPNEELYGASLQTDTPIYDPGTGQTVVIRVFEFMFNPDTLRQIREKKIPAPTRQELFNSNWPRMKMEIWKDGLRAIEEKEFPPRVIIGKKKYRIFIACEKQFKQSFAGKDQQASNLIEVMNNNRLTDKK